MDKIPQTDKKQLITQWSIKGKIYTATVLLGIFFWPIIATIITQNIWYISLIFWCLIILGGIFGKSWKNMENEIRTDIIRDICICIGAWMILFSILQFGCPYGEHLAMCKDLPI